MSKRDAVITLVCLIVCTAILVIVPMAEKDEISPETTVTTEIPTEVKTMAEKATEKPTEAVIVETKTTAPPKEVQDVIDKMSSPDEPTEETTGEIDVNGYGWVQLQYSAQYHIMENHLTRSNGSIRVFGHRETWYSTNERAGQATAVDIPGKHVADDGTIRDKDGYICVASSDLPFYSLVMTSVGPGKVYDCGCSHGTIDVYTTW